MSPVIHFLRSRHNKSSKPVFRHQRHVWGHLSVTKKYHSTEKGGSANGQRGERHAKHSLTSERSCHLAFGLAALLWAQHFASECSESARD